MTTPISEYVSVSVSISDRLLQAFDFGIPAIFDEFTIPSAWETGQRSADYSTLPALAVDFPTATLVYKAASAMFTSDSEYPSPSTVKVIRADSTDDDITDSLNEIELADPDWYALVAAYRLEADINEIAAWIESKSNHIYFACNEDVLVLDGADVDDIASDLSLAEYNRTNYQYHHEGGINPTITTLTVTTLRTVTAAATDHGLRVGDPITIAGATDFGSDADVLNGNFTVATAPDANSFTYTLSEDSTDGLATGTITCAGRYLFPESRMCGLGIPQVAGKITFFGKKLAGQTPIPTTLANLTQQRAARAKNANIYTSIGGLGAYQEGKMASGRYIDIQIGADWIAVRVMEAINQRFLSVKKVPYTDAGIAIIKGDIAGVLQQGLVNGLLADVLVGDTAGRAWIITVPSLENISSTDRIGRTLPDVTVEVRFAGAIHNTIIDITASL